MANTDHAGRMMRDFGKRLRAARELTGYDTAEEFAVELGIEGPRYRKWERGDAWPPLDKLAQINKITNVSMDRLLLNKPPVGESK